MLPFYSKFSILTHFYRLGSPVSAVINFYQKLKQIAQQSNHRQLCCLQGPLQWCFDQSAKIIALEDSNYKWCGESPDSVMATPYQQLLGQDVNLLILNMITQFDANMFAAAEGSVCGGCIIVVLVPVDISQQDHFSQYIQRQLIKHQFPIIQHGQKMAVIPPSSELACQSLYLTEQQLAIQHIIKTVTGHRRRPLVLTANRGRGKSAALGIAAATLINQGSEKILICAPNKQACVTLYKHAQLTLNNKQDLQRLQFIAPDALLIEQPKCDLLIIDEAAAIPIKLLVQFTQHYSRLVFATTQFGYEGSGRGFALRFQQQLNQLAPQWRAFSLNRPIRWSDNDPVEAFTLSSLCLAELNNTTTVINEPLEAIFTLVLANHLINQPVLLNQIFSLLVNAHYQTKPSDLSALLNDTNLSIFIMQQQGQVLAVALVNSEGDFDTITSEQIYQGKRRPSGHLIAQSLTFHSGFLQAANQRYARIQRIAVHPSIQQHTLGSLFLNKLITWAKQQDYDHISASFGATDYLLRFWQKNKFEILRIGTRRDKSSGHFSFMMNMPLSQPGKHLHQQIQTDFNKQVKVQLSRQLTLLDSSLVVSFWPQISAIQSTTYLQQALSAYIDANRGYENVEYLLIELLYASSLTPLTIQQQYCVIEKIIQNHSWQYIAQQHGFTGQKQAQTFLKNCIRDLLTQPREKHHETR